MEKKLLIVDDSNDFVFLVKSILKFNKIDIDCITSPEETKSKITSSDYSLIILDYNMPNTNGLDLAKMIRTILKLDVPIFILSAETFNKETLNVFKSLNLKYIQKPIIPKLLLKHIESSI